MCYHYANDCIQALWVVGFTCLYQCEFLRYRGFLACLDAPRFRPRTPRREAYASSGEYHVYCGQAHEIGRTRSPHTGRNYQAPGWKRILVSLLDRPRRSCRYRRHVTMCALLTVSLTLSGCANLVGDFVFRDISRGVGEAADGMVKMFTGIKKGVEGVDAAFPEIPLLVPDVRARPHDGSRDSPSPGENHRQDKRMHFDPESFWETGCGAGVEARGQSSTR